MGGLFSKPSTPKVQVQAPAVQNPVQQPDFELGAQQTAEEKAKKGKKGLKIDLDKNAGLQKGSVGTNIT